MRIDEGHFPYFAAGFADPFFVAGDGFCLGCRYRRISADAPTVIHFHGNGERSPTTRGRVRGADRRLGANLLLADYRGYQACRPARRLFRREKYVPCGGETTRFHLELQRVVLDETPARLSIVQMFIALSTTQVINQCPEGGCRAQRGRFLMSIRLATVLFKATIVAQLRTIFCEAR